MQQGVMPKVRGAKPSAAIDSELLCRKIKFDEPMPHGFRKWGTVGAESLSPEWLSELSERIRCNKSIYYEENESDRRSPNGANPALQNIFSKPFGDGFRVRGSIPIKAR